MFGSESTHLDNELANLRYCLGVMSLLIVSVDSLGHFVQKPSNNCKVEISELAKELIASIEWNLLFLSRCCGGCCRR